MSQSFVIVQSILVFVICLISGLIYILPSGKKKQNESLCAFLLISAIHILSDLTIETPIFHNLKIHLLPSVLLFLYGPLLYFYVSKLLQLKVSNKRVHYVPSILFFIYYLVYGFSNTIFFPFFGVQFSIYAVVITLMLKSSKNTNRLVKTWSYFLVYTFGLIWFFAFIANVYGSNDLNNIANKVELVSYLISLVFFGGLIYFTMSQPSLFMKVKVSKSNQEKVGDLLSQEEKKRVQLVEIMLEKDKIFKNPDMNRDMLASQLKISPQQLSKEINQHFKMNFSELINKYRIDEAKELLAKGNSSIKETFYEVGFNSRSAFNTAFKKWVRMTPSEYLKSK